MVGCVYVGAEGGSQDRADRVGGYGTMSRRRARGCLQEVLPWGRTCISYQLNVASTIKLTVIPH